MENTFARCRKIDRDVKEGYVFSEDFLQPLQLAILRELVLLPGFIIGWFKVNNMRYGDDTVLMIAIEGKVREHLGKAVKESWKKGLTINC